MQKRLQQWKERKLNRNKKNKGSAMVLVISTIAVIGVLVVTLLSVTLMTLRMKVTQMRSQENFYDAESVLDDINVGLQKRIADAAGTAYTFTLEHYSGASDAVRTSNFMTMFENELLKSNPPAPMESLVDSTGSTMYAKLYNKQALHDMVLQETMDAAKDCQVESAGGANSNVLNIDSAAGTYTFKNVKITYLDNRDYLTMLQTDIVVHCPPINFSQTATTALDLTSFVFVANEQSKITGGDIGIAGSAYLGTDDEAANRCAADYRTGRVTFESVGDNTRLITNGTMYASQGADVTVQGPCTTWAKNVDVDDASVTLGVQNTAPDGTVNPSGTTYLSNDISLGNSSKVKAGGKLISYGTLEEAKTIYGTAAVEANPAAYSSAILINGKDTTLDLNELDSFIIAGNAYVNAERNPIAQGVKINGNKDIVMGESIAMKSDQRAYMVPAQFIAPFCQSGGVNPMLGDKYLALEQELADKLYGGDISKVTSLDYLRASETAVAGVPSELAQLGVSGIQKEVYPMSDNTQMVYFFLVFKDQEAANDFAESYFSKDKNLSALKGRIAANRFNTNIIYSESFKNKQNDLTDYTFYYNGCVIVPDGENTKVLTGKLKYQTVQYSVKLKKETENHQEDFAKLRHKLVTGEITQDELNKSVYDNLVKPMTDADPKKNISSGNKKIFALNNGPGIAPEAAMCAVVVNNKNGSAYVLNNPTSDAYQEATEMCGTERLPVHVVIASGDVEVKCNFRGMIIAGGKITIDNQNKTLKADSNLTQQALRIKDGDGIRAVDYLVAGDNCLVDGAGSGNSQESTLAFSEYVTYSNWQKQ